MTFNQKPQLGRPINIKHSLAKGLIGSWLMNESSGNIVFDSSHEKYNSTNIGASWVPLGLDFDGADRVQLPQPIINNLDAFTITIRFNGAHSGIVYSEGYNVNTAWVLFLGIDDAPPYSARFYFKENNVWKALTVGTTPVNDGWHTVTLSQINKSYRTIHIDGILEGINTDTVGDMSILNTANIGVLERTTFVSYFVGDIEYVHLHNRGLSDNEAALINNKPYSMFQKLIVPVGLFGRILYLATNLFDGKIIIRNSTTNLVDGKVNIKDSIINLIDSKIQIKDIITIIVDGKISIKDSVINLLDGKLQVKNTATNLVDGLINIKNSITTIVDGKTIISNVSTSVIDGKIKIKDITTSIFDGLLTIKYNVTNLFDGLINFFQRHKLTTSSEKEHIITTSEEHQHILTTSHEYQHNLRSDYD